MKIIEVLTPFKWSDNGWDVTEYQAGDILEVSDECADVEADLGNAKVLSAADLDKAKAAYDKLLRAAVKAQAAADAAKAKAADLQGVADAAKALAEGARIGRQAEADAQDLPDDEPQPEVVASELAAQTGAAALPNDQPQPEAAPVHMPADTAAAVSPVPEAAAQ